MTGDVIPGDATSAAEPLARIVDRQRRENVNLQIALRTRAVIEQAKGILVARTGVDPETAFQRLITHSQQVNRKLSQVAAEVVAATVGQPGSDGGPSDDRRDAGRRSPDPETFLTAAAVIAAPDFHELLGAIIQHGQRFGVRGGTLVLAEPDGALRIVGHHGPHVQTVSGWLRIPPGMALPVTSAAHDRQEVWIRDRDELEELFPAGLRFPGHGQACGAIPLEFDRQLVGVLVLDWDEPNELVEETRRSLTSVAELCVGPIAQLLRDYDDPLPGLDVEPAHSRWFWAFLDAQPIPYLVLEPRVEDDDILDLIVVHGNPPANAATGLSPGGSMLEHFPRLAEEALVVSAAQVLRSGVPHEQQSVAVPAGDDSAIHVEDVAICRIGTLLIASWATSSRD